MKRTLLALLSFLISVVTASAQESLDTLVERGGELFHAQPLGCATCHGDRAQGLVGPTLVFGPTPVDIFEQLESNPTMAPVMAELNLADDDLIAVAMYVRTFADLPLEMELPDGWRRALAEARAARAAELVFPRSRRDLAVEAVESFESVVTNWERRSKPGSLTSSYDARTVATFDAGEPKFEPQANRTYFYENVGTNSKPAVLYSGFVAPKSNQVVVGDAQTKEVLASYEFPVELRNAVHATAASPDGRFVYIVGPRAPGPDGTPDPGAAQTMLKVDALTLQPVKQITIGGRLHHGQVFQDRYLLLDVFGRDPDGLGVMLFDPETDTVVGGARDVDLGGMVYTTWTDNEFIYALMEPAGYGPGRSTGGRGAGRLRRGELVAMRPFWVAKIDPENWEVVREYPLPGYRGTWGVVDAAKEHLYVVMSGSSNLAKIDLASGDIVWTRGTGAGPYGASLTADESAIWVASKGENMGEFGRTISVLDATTGDFLATLFAAYEVDHVLLSPDGREMWATSNGEGRVLVYDAATRELEHVVDMPQNGDAHGLVWVHYDGDGEPRVVRDQGGFHGGVNPALGRPLRD